MVYFFDIEKAAKAAGIETEAITKIKEDVRKDFPKDDMMYELHVLRAIESILHPLKRDFSNN